MTNLELKEKRKVCLLERKLFHLFYHCNYFIDRNPSRVPN
jgi:hypothetical protein